MANLAHKVLEKSRLREGPKTTGPLRIAVSVLCVAVGLFLVVLWVRSYTWRDYAGLQLYAQRMVRVFSQHGKLEFETYANMGEQGSSVRTLSHEDISAAWRRFTDEPQPRDRDTWRWEHTRTGRFFVYVPHWFLVLLAGAVAATPWISWRFSLRTLLIGVTFIALLLGLLVISNSGH